MQFCRSKQQQAGLQYPPGLPAILCYCRDRACSRLCSFFGKSIFYGHFLHAAPYFPVVYRETGMGSGETSRFGAAFKS